MRGNWLAAGAAFLLLVGACAPPNQALNNVSPSPSESSSPSPSPTPTTAFAASGPGFHAGEVGVGYPAVALAATGGVQPYHWTVASGALPPGLTLGSDGSVSGTPTSAGSFGFTIQAADSGDSKASIPGTISVAAHLTAGLLPACAQYCRVELGCANACGAFGTFSGGIAPYTIKLIQGPLPVGTSLSPSSLTLNGTFGGQPGYLPFTVQVGDAFGATASVTPTFWMYPHIALASGGCSTTYGTDCTAQLKISGGIPNDRFTVSLVRNDRPGPNQGCGAYGPAPAGSLGVSGSNVVIDVPGRWPFASGYGAVWTLQVTDSALCAPSTYCTSNLATAVVEVQCG